MIRRATAEAREPSVGIVDWSRLSINAANMRQSSLTISTPALNFAKLRGCKLDKADPSLLRDASVTLDEDPVPNHA